MSRFFYIALGAASGVLVVRQAARAVSALSPTSVAGSLVQSMREFAADVAQAMAEREEEIRSALGLDDADGPGGTGADGGTGEAGGPVALVPGTGPGSDEFDPERTMRLVLGNRRP